MKIAAKFSLVMALMLGGTATSRAAFINFDDVVGSDGYYTSPTNVSTHYASLGVTFTDPWGPSGVVAKLAPTNVFVANQHQTSDAEDLRLDFSVPVNLVTLDVAGLYNSAVIEALAYDSSHKLIGTFDFAQQNVLNAPAVTGTISTGADNISYLLLADHPYSDPGTFNNFYIDNLSFGVSAVPEPATWAMMITGFLGIGTLAWRRRKAAALAV